MISAKFDFKLWIVFVLLGLIPAIQNTIRIYFIGEMPNESELNISSQIQWLSILYEILKEGLMVPLFFMFSKEIKEKQSINIAGGFILVVLIHLLFSIFIFAYAESLLSFMAVDMENKGLVHQASVYIKLESVAILFSVAVEYLIIYLASKSDYFKLFSIVLMKSILLEVCDLFLISEKSYSLNLGVNGIAISNIIVSVFLTVFIVLYLRHFFMFKYQSFKLDKQWFKKWLELGSFSGLESLIRNTVFLLMILRIVNQVNESGNYWIANSVIWGFLLLPSLALSQVVNRDIALDKNNIIFKTRTYFLLILVFALLWLLLMPNMENILNKIIDKNNDVIIRIITIQTPFYILFMFNNCILDATMKALGLNKYMLYQSICVDIIYYGIVFCLYSYDKIQMNIETITYIFSLGMLIDFIPSFYLYKKALNQNGIQLRYLIR